ncbi:2-amino-4-hydroxy-6-hydroxymethyldihydropteridine diphosphokinase [Herbaspirillum sp. RTI4]|uniref:2-amino-4-hydroxy-6- hydroxymethyldihydropteridine diphosphokinase n=1 Tax=Herbaspirillum sp. RTI4 TaxID=3048640 RepID=UPI002AB3B45E|nr:2-amino-4-hydroxy-6-hydroxymethyldihydropteridine diphosphokinase [Herbaspirillum sp. RTI4]MDY7576845.1 2-amino-4-hydroxy-6-hydroxymethyldihydropteridine diphosphokinase [Herbaspirillum sp. RTI4]MEA9983354.1 2-amino-4-hydroxy-6-hydroxymethyldihydropteridine diphosphokinase [Herbaspirillum sp. RTI4]
MPDVRPGEYLAYLGIGANLGDATVTVRAAVEAIAALDGTRLLRVSSLFGSAPVDADGDDYINAVAAIATVQEPLALLTQLQGLEQDFGRQRSYRNAPRTLDIDLLLYADWRIDSTRLTVPHPRMSERAFVLLPLLEIAPDIDIPGLGAASQFIDTVSDQRIQRM